MNRIRLLEGVVVSAAIGVRLAAASSLSSTGYSRYPLVDAYTYWAQATRLFDGGDPFVGGFYQPPGYPIFLSWLQHIGATDVWGPRFLQLGLGLMTTVLLMYIGRRLGGEKRPWFGAVAGAVYTLYPTTVLFELDLLTPACTGFITAVLLVLVTPSAALWQYFSAALLAGLASTLHPSFLIVSGAIAVMAWFNSVMKWRAIGCVLAGLLFGLMPITQANIDRFDRVQFTSNNAGINFYMGNNPDWKRTAFLRPGLPFRQLALEAEPHKRDGFSRNEYWMDRAWSEIAAAPHQWVRTLATKALWSVSDTEIPRNEDYRCRTQSGPMEWLGFRLIRYGLIFPLAFLGALSVWRRRSDAEFAVLAWIALQVPVVVFIVADRYRVATWPMMCLLVPFGLEAVRQLDWRKGARRFWFVFALVAPWIPLDDRTKLDPAWCAHVEGNLAYMDGDMSSAERHYRTAVLLDPGDWSAHTWLASALAKRGEIEEASVHLNVVLDDFPDSFPTLRTAAKLKAQSGDYTAAAELMIRAYEVPGNRTNTGMRAVRYLLRSGQAARAEEMLRQDPALAKRWSTRE